MDLLALNFNQDNSCLSVGTNAGYRIYNCDPFGKCYAKECEGTVIVEMLFCTSLVALVSISPGSPRRLQIVNTKRQSKICELTFHTSVLGVRMNRKRLAVVLEEQIYLYEISNMHLLHTIEMPSNPLAVCALSPSSENCYLLYPTALAQAPSANPTHSPATDGVRAMSGDVTIFDALTLQPINIVQAHKSPIGALAINSDGTMMATASEKGTVIRVFSVPSAQRLFHFRRGTYPARIHSLSFDAASEFLCAASDTDTVHIFSLMPEKRPPRGENGNAIVDQNSPNFGRYIRKSSQSLGRSLAGAVGGYLPSQFSEMWEPQRDFASIKLPQSGSQRVIAAIGHIQSTVMVATVSGTFYQYHMDLQNGGDCQLVKTFSLLDLA